jgi:hypothetical protein
MEFLFEALVVIGTVVIYQSCFSSKAIPVKVKSRKK